MYPRATMSRSGRVRPLPAGGSPYGRAPGSAGISAHPGIEQRAAERLVDRAIDPDTHNLHAGVGERCMICDRVIVRGNPVRRTISGGYAHDNC